MTRDPLTDEELASIEHGSTWIEGVGGPNAILHRLVAEVRRLRAENADLRAALKVHHDAMKGEAATMLVQRVLAGWTPPPPEKP
jgi:hypothetical protein